MNFFKIGKQTGDAIAKPIEAIGNTFDKLFTSDEERKAAEIVLKKIEQEPHILQGEITKLESQNPNLFVSGWRPCIGWICGIGLSIHFIFSPIMEWVMQIIGKQFEPPKLDISSLLTLVIALLGLGTQRTIERLQGVARLK